MKPIIVDMNLSPLWIPTLRQAGFEATHWSNIGHATDDDIVIMDYARQQKCIVLTHDMDFGMLLALTKATFPSVIQARTLDVMPQSLATSIIAVLRQYQESLDIGALIVVDSTKTRVRLLPLG